MACDRIHVYFSEDELNSFETPKVQEILQKPAEAKPVVAEVKPVVAEVKPEIKPVEVKAAGADEKVPVERKGSEEMGRKQLVASFKGDLITDASDENLSRFLAECAADIPALLHGLGKMAEYNMTTAQIMFDHPAADPNRTFRLDAANKVGFLRDALDALALQIGARHK